MASLFPRTSVTVDEAVAILLGLANGPILFRPLSDEVSQEEQDEIDSQMFVLQEYLDDATDLLVSGLAEAKFDELPKPIIDEKREALQKHRAVVSLANRYLCDINAELNEGEASALKLDATRSNSSCPYITLSSLDAWAVNKRYRESILVPVPTASSLITPTTDNQRENESFLKNVEERKPLPMRTESWWVIESSDPRAAQDWYIPARYFARQLVKDDSTLLTKKEMLANKVVQSLSGVGIFKRGGKLPFDPGTVKKAFVNVRLK